LQKTTEPNSPKELVQNPKHRLMTAQTSPMKS